MKARIGDLPVGTMFLLIGDTAPLVIKGRNGDAVILAAPGQFPHMTLDRPAQEVEVVAVPSGYRHRWRTMR